LSILGSSSRGIHGEALRTLQHAYYTQVYKDRDLIFSITTSLHRCFVCFISYSRQRVYTIVLCVSGRLPDTERSGLGHQQFDNQWEKGTGKGACILIPIVLSPTSRSMVCVQSVSHSSNPAPVLHTALLINTIVGWALDIAMFHSIRQ